MPENKSLVGQVIDQSGGVLEKAYDDLAHPTAKSVGNTLSLVPRTIGVWLGKWEKWIINGEESIRLTAQAVEQKAAIIPEEKLTEPDAYVAIPAIQQLSYCYDSEVLRDMYANLLVSSMNIDKKSQVHPSFVDIIKQMTPDEAKLLQVLPKTSVSYSPLVDLQVNLGNGRGHVCLLRNYTTLGDAVCELPGNICSYIDNLDRLKIIRVIEEVRLMNGDRYHEMENSPFLLAHKNVQIGDGQSFSIKRKSFVVTEFGTAFITTCVSPESSNN